MPDARCASAEDEGRFIGGGGQCNRGARCDGCIAATTDHDEERPSRFSRNAALRSRNCNAARADDYVDMTKLNKGKRLQVQSAAAIAVLEVLTGATLTVEP